MRRRELLTLLGCLSIVLPRSVAAQQSPIPVIGFLNPAFAADWANPLAAFRQGLAEAGYVEGRNVTIEYQFAKGHYDRLPSVAADFVRRRVAVIAATGGLNVLRVAKTATQSIPIVFTVGYDPAKAGLVASLSRPGGNATGVTLFSDLLATKWLELLLELVPTAAAIGMLVNPNSIAETLSTEFQAAAQARARKVHVVKAATGGEITAAFAQLARHRVDALLVVPDPVVDSHRPQLVELAARHAIPAVSAFREFPAAGGLMSYGGSIADAYRTAGLYAGRILKGEKPGDLPIQQPTKFELVINMRTARALGITVPTAVMARADELIE